MEACYGGMGVMERPCAMARRGEDIKTSPPSVSVVLGTGTGRPCLRVGGQVQENIRTNGKGPKLWCAPFHQSYRQYLLSAKSVRLVTPGPSGDPC